MRMTEIDFLIIGAAKSATTWLQRALQADPNVTMPDPELHYFSRNYERGHGWYEDQFPPHSIDATIGEKSNSYLEAPEAAARIADALPRVKLIAQLRDPVKRAYSDYCMLFRRGEVDGRIAHHLDPRNTDGRFIALGHYREQIERFTDRFPIERFLFLSFEAATTSPIHTLQQVHDFLELPAPVSGAGERKVKDRRTPTVPTAWKPYLRPLKPFVAPFRSSTAFQTLHAGIASEIEYPPMPAELEARLRDHYARPNERLAALTGLDIAPWSNLVPIASHS